MSNATLPTLSSDNIAFIEEAVIRSLQNWAGWPEPDWLVEVARRKTGYGEPVIRDVVKNMLQRRVIVSVTHKEQTVLRME